jgi:large subunit ribosomal protein L22
MGKNIKLRKQKKLEAKNNSTDASKAILRLARVSPRKARLVADMIRGEDVDSALIKLRYTRKKSARLLEKLVDSAVANAQQKNSSLDVDTLRIKTIFVDQGPTLRRFRPRARGMAYRIHKKTSHITVILEPIIEAGE